jgi:hypothetical protein
MDMCDDTVVSHMYEEQTPPTLPRLDQWSVLAMQIRQYLM